MMERIPIATRTKHLDIQHDTTTSRARLIEQKSVIAGQPVRNSAVAVTLAQLTKVFRQYIMPALPEHGGRGNPLRLVRDLVTDGALQSG